MGQTLHRFRGGAYLVSVRAHSEQVPVEWRGEPVLNLDAVGIQVMFTPTVGAGLKRALLDAGRVELRLRAGRERIRLTPAARIEHSRICCRSRPSRHGSVIAYRLLVCDGRLVWAAGIGMDADFQAGPEDAGLTLQVRAGLPTLLGLTAVANRQNGTASACLICGPAVSVRTARLGV